MAKQRKSSKTQIKKKFQAIVTIISLLLILGLAITNYYEILTYHDVIVFFKLADKPASNAEVSVHYIDVGQGDCILIISEEMSVLIDAGESEYGQKVASYIKAQGIKKLDYIIATHPHSDHIGGLPIVIEQLEVGKIILPKLADDIVPTTKSYESLLYAIKNKGLKITQAKTGDNLDLGVSSLEIYAPLKEYKDLNNYSIVCKLIHKDNTFLFMGDAESEAEDDLIDEGIDLSSKVLKVGHHGSNTSSKKDFLEKVNPRYCVVMCGSDNSYNHPNIKTISKLNDYTDDIFRTDLLGTIVFESDGKGINYSYELDD